MTSKDFKKILTDKLSGLLKPRQFKKTGSNFHFSNGDLTYFIGLQSSQSSTADTLKATINIEIASTPLAKLDETGLPEKHIRHFNARIGSFLDKHEDRWWTINNEDTANKSADEINEILLTSVFKLFDTLQSTKDLADQWRQNKYFGLTEGQRKHYLQLYDNNYSD